MSVKCESWSVELDVMDEKRTVKDKSKKFAVRIVRLYQYLSDEKHEYVLSKQILRSGTSIGANIAESECAISRRDFVAKLYIALKECMETLYWLDLLRDTEYITQEQYSSLEQDCQELRKMLSSATKTINSKP